MDQDTVVLTRRHRERHELVPGSDLEVGHPYGGLPPLAAWSLEERLRLTLAQSQWCARRQMCGCHVSASRDHPQPPPPRRPPLLRLPMNLLREAFFYCLRVRLRPGLIVGPVKGVVPGCGTSPCPPRNARLRKGEESRWYPSTTASSQTPRSSRCPSAGCSHPASSVSTPAHPPRTSSRRHNREPLRAACRTSSTTVPSPFTTLTSRSSKSHSTLTLRFAPGYQRFLTHPCGRAPACRSARPSPRRRRRYW